MTIVRSRIFFVTILTCAGLLILALVVISPLALRGLLSIYKVNWAQLADIGQTYGAVSAVLATLALIGVSASVLFQIRESRSNRIQASRTHQFEINKVRLDDTFYFQAEYIPELPSDEAKRMILYVNLRVQYWQMLWSLGTLSEIELRNTLAPGLFATNIGRAYWERSHDVRRQSSTSRPERRFNQILDEVYRDSVRKAPGVGPDLMAITSESSRKTINLSRSRLIKAVGLAATGAAFATVLYRVSQRGSD
jgi:hypothetical protein